MYVAYVVTAVLLAFVLTDSARAKLIREEKVTSRLTGLGVPVKMFPMLAGLELAGAVGLLVGVFRSPIGTAAAVGVVLYFLGAFGTHMRGRDWKNSPASVIFFFVAAAALALRVAS
ncbi:DoxX family protein [Nocardia sp. NPDC004750]